jgi:cytoskeletal protein RodZ
MFHSDMNRKMKNGTFDNLAIAVFILMAILAWIGILWSVIHISNWIWPKPHSKPAPVVNPTTQYWGTRYQFVTLYDEPSAKTKDINTIETITHENRTTRTIETEPSMARNSGSIYSLSEPIW